MTENQPQEPVTVVLLQDSPTTKQQLTSAAIQIGAALAVPVLFVVGLGAVGVVSSVKDKIAARKLRKHGPDLTVVPLNPED